MNRANFYGQTPLGLYRTRSSGIHPQVLESWPSLGDQWQTTKAASSFEQNLTKEINEIKLMSDSLSKKMAQAQSDGASLDKKEINEAYQAIMKAKKTVALIVEQMRKSMEAIAANFR